VEVVLRLIYVLKCIRQTYRLYRAELPTTSYYIIVHLFLPTHSHTTTMLTRPLHRQPFSLLRLIRLNSTSSTPPPPTSARAQVQPTSFTEKSAPRNVHDRPEQIRGFPPAKSGPQWQKPVTAGTPQSENGGQAFDGPSRPRLVYARGPRRDLPSFKVGLILQEVGVQTDGRTEPQYVSCSPLVRFRKANG